MDRIDLASLYGALAGGVVSLITPRKHETEIDVHENTGVRLDPVWVPVSFAAGGLVGGYISSWMFPQFNPVMLGLVGGGLGATLVLIKSTGLDDVTHFFW